MGLRLLRKDKKNDFVLSIKEVTPEHIRTIESRLAKAIRKRDALKRRFHTSIQHEIKVVRRWQERLRKAKKRLKNNEADNL